MGWSADKQPEGEYRRWLEALAKAMGSDKADQAAQSPPWSPEPAGLLESDATGLEGAQNPFAQSPPEPISSQSGASPAEAGKTLAISSPRIWDLCKPYVLLVAVVLLGGLAGIGSLVWLAQWWIPPTRPPASESPIEAQWEVRRRGLHILPDPDMPSPILKPSAAETSSEQSASEPPGAEKP